MFSNMVVVKVMVFVAKRQIIETKILKYLDTINLKTVI